MKFMKKYQQILRVVEYMFCHFLSCGFASFCDFCFALSFVLSFCCHFLVFFVVFSSGAGGWTRSRPRKSAHESCRVLIWCWCLDLEPSWKVKKNVTLRAHDHFVCIVCRFFAFPKLEVFFALPWHFISQVRKLFCDFLHFPNQNDKEITKNEIKMTT